MKNIQLWEKTPLLRDGDSEVYMTYYPAEGEGNCAMIIYAGGGYGHRARHEGEGYAEHFSKFGIHCFVVHYRVSPYVFPVELLDARRSVRYVRANAALFGIDPSKIVVIGSSAGGHLAALVSTYKGAIDGEGADAIDEIDPTPNAQVLCYPVLDFAGHKGSYTRLLGEDRVDELADSVTPMLLASSDTPISFMWHCEGDKVVDPRNTIRYSIKLLDLGVSHELHIFPRGRHGVGLVYNDERFVGEEYMESWADMCIRWLRLNGFIK